MDTSRGWSSPTESLSPRTSRRRRRRFDPWLLLSLGPLPLALLLVGAVAWYHFLFGGFGVSGLVLDAESQAPVAAARIWTPRGVATTGADGTFTLNGFKPPESIGVDAPGYQGQTVRPFLTATPLRVLVQPVAFEVAVRDAENGKPVPARVQSGDRSAELTGDGHFRLAPVQSGARLTVEAPGYARQEVTFDGTTGLAEVTLTPTFEGRVVDARSGAPVPRARLRLGDTVLETKADGTYQLPRRPTNEKMVVLQPGYRQATVDFAQGGSYEVRLEPFEPRALYLTYHAIGHPTFVKLMDDLLNTTELNSVVIDVKGDLGLLSYTSRVPLAQQIGANENPTIQDLDALLKSLHDRGIYAIARIVVFKDNVLATNGQRAGLDVAIKDGRTGKPWVDGENLAWVDPFQSAAWDYNVALAREAIERGFDEVQFDYIRFPTDPSAGNSIDNTTYSRPFTEANRVEALSTFLSRARTAVNDAGGYLAIDTFGYTTWWDDDGGIGQDLAALASHVDYVCPMVYPSTFSAGLPGQMPFPDVVQHPYEVIYESLKHAQPKLEGKRVVMRPWLQYFDDYPWETGFRYDAPQIEAQKKATKDGGGIGWMLWDPANTYSRGGMAPRQ